MSSIYLNTDLVIVVQDNPSHLLAVLNEKCELIHCQKGEDSLWHISANACNSGIVGSDEHNPTRDVSELLQVIEELNKETKVFLQEAAEFDFNIGWQSSDKHPEGAFSLPNALLRRIATTGATLTVTIYPSEEQSCIRIEPKEESS